VIGYFTVVEAQLLAGLAHRTLGDRWAANQAAERALALAEADRLVLPFAMTGSRELLEALPRHETVHASLLTGILDFLSGSSAPAGNRRSSPPAEQLSPAELRVLRYLPTNMSRPEIATKLSVSVNTVSSHIRSIYAKLGAEDRSTAVHRARELRLLSAVRTLASAVAMSGVQTVAAIVIKSGWFRLVVIAGCAACPHGERKEGFWSAWHGGGGMSYLPVMVMR
jgi:LuxR family maltose regulon positive regulatory protein